MTKANQTPSHSGSILVMAAIFISCMLMLASISFYILQRATAKEQWGSVWNLIGLAGVQEYFKINCETAGFVGSQCHEAKIEASIIRMQEIADANTSMVSSLTVFKTGGATPEGNYLKVTPGKYFYKQVDEDIDDCSPSPYPCFVPLTAIGDANALANSFEIEGRISHGRLTQFIFNGFTGSDKNMDLVVKRKVAAVPLAVAILIDLSLSTQTINHLDLANPPPGSPDNSFFAFNYLHDAIPANRIVQPAQAAQIWADLDNTRATGVEYSWEYHFKDDYVAVNSYNDNSDYNTYENHEKHPPPDGEPDNEQHHLVNVYRDDNYKGPEPFLSIVKGARKGLDLVEKRQVSGDSVTLVAYSDRIPWRHVVSRTTDFSYLKQVLDGDSLASDVLHPGYPNNPLNYQVSSPGYPFMPPISKNDINAPLWLRLGLYPAPGSWTDTLQGVAKAVEQMSTGLGDVPTVKAVLHFTDGIVNCSSTLQGTIDPDTLLPAQRCRDRYSYYKQGMIDLKMAVNDSMARNGVAMHTFLVGNAAHYMAIPASETRSEPAGENSSCLTDAESRGLNIDFVEGQTFADDNQADAAYVNKNVVPFYQAAYDAYVLTKMTGGRWGALLPVPASCDVQEDPCSGLPAATRIVSDPFCRSIEQQVSDYIEDVILNSKAFAVVE